MLAPNSSSATDEQHGPAAPGSVMLSLPTCLAHPGSLIRRYRTHGPNGPGVYPQCLPAGDGAPHLLAWPQTEHAAAAKADTAALSPSEHRVLEDASHGMTVNETATNRAKSPETVKSQRRSILLKLGARNMAQAVGMMTADVGEPESERVAS
jgi:DNA-binding CsgD family transcriptional regulator